MTKKRIALKIVRRVGICILTTVVLLLIGLLGVVRIMEFGPSKTARNLFVNSAMESSAGGILVTLFFSDEEIARIRAINSIQKTDEVTDSSLISDTTILTQEEKSMISLQRNISSIYGKTIEMQEIKANVNCQISVYNIMIVIALTVLYAR